MRFPQLPSIRTLSILLVVAIGIGIFGFQTVAASNYVLLEGYSGSLSGSTGSNPFSLYFLDVKNQPENTTLNLHPLIFAFGDSHQISTNEMYSYYGQLGDPSQKIKQKLVLFSPNGVDNYEWVLFFSQDGKLDLSKSIMGKVRPTDESQSSSKCFYASFSDITQTGNCDYFTVDNSNSVSAVQEPDLEWVRDLVHAYVDGEKNIETAPNHNSEAKVTYIENDSTKGTQNAQYAPGVYREVDGVPVSKGETSNPSTGEVPVDPGKGAVPSSTKNVAGSAVAGATASTSGPNSQSPFFFRLPTKAAPLVSSPISSALFSTTLLSQGFESGIPSSWTAQDIDTGNGLDYWGSVTNEHQSGTKSVWSAAVGDQYYSDAFTEGFVIPFTITNWTSWDNTQTNKPYWGYSTSHSHTSAYSAAVNNPNPGQYANNMNSWITRNGTYDASTWSSASLNFNTWYNTETNYDKLQVLVNYDGSSTWWILCEYSGNSSGWTSKSCNIPSTYLSSILRVGYAFVSDSTVTNEGAYVDDIVLSYNKSNISQGQYDDDMESVLQTPAVSTTNYTNINASYYAKVAAESGYDYFKSEISADGSNWISIAQTSSTGSAWQQTNYNFGSSTTGNIYLRYTFHSDSSVHNYTGAYLDNVQVTGDQLLPDGSQCSSPNQCQSGVCGGAHTESYNHCHVDGSINVFGNRLNYANTCGGGGTYTGSDTDYYSGTCSTSKVCDIDFPNTTPTFSTTQICKTSIPNTCSSSPDCWNDNGGVDCMGTSSKICTYGNNGDYCTENAQCDSNQCYQNQCSTGLPNGSACSLDTACASQLCVANICQAQSSYNPNIIRTDNWDSSNSNGASTANDGAVFVNGTVYPDTNGLREQTDMLCYDLNGDGTYDVCYYDPNGCGVGGCAANSCDYFSIPSAVTNKYSCDIDTPNGCRIGLDGGTAPKICTGSGCLVSTSTGSDYRQIQAKAYTDCDNSNSLRAETSMASNFSDAAYVVDYAKYYEAIDNTLSQPNYFTIGQFGYSDQNAYETTSAQCPTNQAVDRVAEEQRVYTQGGTIPSVCKKVPGQSCSSNSECLYNVCSSNQCQLSSGIKGHLYDETLHPISNQTMKIYTCSNTLISTTTTDTYGKYGFYIAPGNYKIKTVAPWGETTFVWSGEPSGCHNYANGFNDIWTTLYTHAHIHGTALDPAGNPSVNLPFEATTCQNTVLDTDTTNSNGNFSLDTNTGNQALKVDINGTYYPIVDQNNFSCHFRAGDVSVGNLLVTANCSLYNNTCSNDNPDVRLFNCHNSTANGCECAQITCDAGCTEGAPQCNAIGTGTIKVTVQDVNGNPIPYVDVSVDNVPRGRTNGWGKKDINTLYGSHSVKATCPGGTPFSQSTAYLNGNQKYVSYTLNCPAQPKGELKIIANSYEGNPVSNVYIFVDDDTEHYSLSDNFGVATVEDIPYGSHSIIIGYKPDENSVALQFTTQVTIDSPNVDMNQTILMPGQPGYSSMHITSASPQFIPVIIFVAEVALAAYTVYEAAEQTHEYCSCVYPNSDEAPKLAQCISDVAVCPATIIFSSNEHCRDWLQKHHDNSGICQSKFLTAGVTVAASVIPADKVLNLLGKVAEKTGATIVVDKIGEVASTSASSIMNKVNSVHPQSVTGQLINYAKNSYGYVAEKLTPIGGAILRYKAAVDVGISAVSLSDEGALAANSLVERVGLQNQWKAKEIVGASEDFTPQYFADRLNDLGDLRVGQSFSQNEYAKVESSIAEKIVGENWGNLKGNFGELKSLKAEETFISQVNEYEPAYVFGSDTTKLDWKLNNGDVIEAKNVAMGEVSPNEYNGEIEDIVRKFGIWDYFRMPGQKLNVVFTKGAPSSIKENVELRIMNGIREINSQYGSSDVTFYWMS